AGLLLVVTPTRPPAVTRSSTDQAWSEAAVSRELGAGHPVFVYFTADWCLTCKVNEVGSIDRAEVRDAFKAANVAVLVGDWTDGDPAITRFLESRGGAGLPYYLWYAPGKPPEELPQLLTPSMLISRAQSVRQGREAGGPTPSSRRPKSPKPAYCRAKQARPWSDRGRRR